MCQGYFMYTLQPLDPIVFVSFIGKSRSILTSANIFKPTLSQLVQKSSDIVHSSGLNKFTHSPLRIKIISINRPLNAPSGITVLSTCSPLLFLLDVILRGC